MRRWVIAPAFVFFCILALGGMFATPKRGIARAIQTIQDAVAHEDLTTVEGFLLSPARERWWIAGLRGALARRDAMGLGERDLVDRMYAEYRAMVAALEIVAVTGGPDEAAATLRMPVVTGGYRLVLDFPTTWRRDGSTWRLVSTDWDSRQWTSALLAKGREYGGPENHTGYPPFFIHRPPPPEPTSPPRLPRARFSCPREMAPVPGGPAWMRYSGQRYLFSGEEDHVVQVGDFCIDRYEASRPKATAESPDNGHYHPAASRPGVLPWVLVTWDQARAACEKVGKRLCSGAEWQKAAGGPDGWLFPHGNTFDPAVCNTYDPTTGPRQLAPTGAFPKCRSPYGAYDLCGNVSEWTDEAWQEGMNDRVLRGGSYNENPINGQGLYPFFGWRFSGYGEEVSAIHHHPRDDAHEDDGFRCCLTPIR